MIKRLDIISWVTIGVAIFILDRITKLLAVTYFNHEYSINPFVYFQLVFNRGISWGIGHSLNSIEFVAITVLTCSVTCGVFIYAFQRLKQGFSIFGEILVLTGSISNILDRFLYGGVVDFIIFDFKSWIFPAFNLADSAIVCGVMYMFVQLLIKNEKNELPRSS